jgi:hypothetical protein
LAEKGKGGVVNTSFQERSTAVMPNSPLRSIR